jgi:hypothetical protein
MEVFKFLLDIAKPFVSPWLDVLLGFIGIAPDSRLGHGLTDATITALAAAALAAIGALLLWLNQVAARARQAAGIRERKAAAKNPLLIVLADLKGDKDGKASGELRDLIAQAAGDLFPAHTGSVLVERLAYTFPAEQDGKPKRNARTRARVMKRAAALDAAVAIYGDADRQTVRLHLLSAHDAQKAERFGYSRGDGERLAAAAIGFFAAGVADKAKLDPDTVKAKNLVAYAERLAPLVQAIMAGKTRLTLPQQEAVKAAFDRAGFAAFERAFPNEEALETLRALRRARAEASGLVKDWLAFAEGAVMRGGAWLNEAQEKLTALRHSVADPGPKAALLVLLANILNNADAFADARDTAQTALALSPPRRTAARASVAFAWALGELGFRTEGAAGIALLDQAYAAAGDAIAAADPADLDDWMSAHVVGAQAVLFSLGRGDPARAASRARQGEAWLDACLAPAGGQALPEAPRAIAWAAVVRCGLLDQAVYYDTTRPRRETDEAILAAATSAYALIPAGRAPVYAAQLARYASVALKKLGQLESSPTRLAAAIDWAEKAALGDADDSQAAFGWSDAALARITRAELWASAASDRPASEKLGEAREELQKAIDTLEQIQTDRT